MSYSLNYDKIIDCIILTFEDTVTMDLIREAAPQTARMCVEKNCWRILNDMSAVTIEVSLIDVFASPQVMEESNLKGAKRALVVPSTFAYSHFLEAVTRARGHNFMIFNDIEEAKQWLQSEE